jgi:release factor glutamine methyltransferase
LFDGLPKKFKCDVIISNPPYLSSNEYEELGLDVKLWEDKNALVADDIGMKFYKKILSNACKHLNRYDYAIPQIVLEIGPAQSLIEGVLQEFGYSDFEIYKDMQGRNRWIAIYLN